jgi:hypothetical protein
MSGHSPASRKRRKIESRAAYRRTIHADVGASITVRSLKRRVQVIVVMPHLADGVSIGADRYAFVNLDAVGLDLLITRLTNVRAEWRKRQPALSAPATESGGGE